MYTVTIQSWQLNKEVRSWQDIQCRQHPISQNTQEKQHICVKNTLFLSVLASVHVWNIQETPRKSWVIFLDRKAGNWYNYNRGMLVCYYGFSIHNGQGICGYLVALLGEEMQ